MTHVQYYRSNPAILLTALMGGMLLGSCAPAAPPASESAIPLPATRSAADSAANPAVDGVMSQQQADSSAKATAEIPRSQPQLIKTAELAVTVKSVEDGINTVKTIARQQQGDLLELQDQTPTDENSRHTAAIQIRVPQGKLETALQALKALGTVENQSITAEDVSSQLVDYQSRLRNLRRSEETLLDIMGRSGSVGDVLKVAQELSNVRNSIEQIDAQLNSLQNQVAYSTVNLSLEETIATIQTQRSTQAQIQETWNGATHSLGRFTITLLQLGIWLLVYSPYWLLLAGGTTLFYLRFKSRQSSASAGNPDPPASV